MNPCRATDVQLEFVMLDPYVRTTLKHNGKVFNSKMHIPLRSPATLDLCGPLAAPRWAVHACGNAVAARPWSQWASNVATVPQSIGRTGFLLTVCATPSLQTIAGFNFCPYADTIAGHGSKFTL